MNDSLRPAGLRETVLWLFRRRYRFQVTGQSMLPLLKPGEELLVDPNAYRNSLPQPGDIIIARHPHRPDLKMVKRVEAIIKNELVVLKGDNPTESTDSRIFGPVTREHLLGRVTSRFG